MRGASASTGCARSNRRRQWLSRRLLPSTPMTSGRGCHVVRTSSSVRWMLSVSMWTVADSSMRGFDRWLHRGVAGPGCARVVAVDVGYGQLAWSLRSDDRVKVIERTNVRELSPGMIGGQVEGIVADLSFISLATVLPALTTCASPDADIVPMVKPQFEVGKDQVVPAAWSPIRSYGNMRWCPLRHVPRLWLAYRRSRSEPTAGTFRQCRILPVVTFRRPTERYRVMNWLPR